MGPEKNLYEVNFSQPQPSSEERLMLVDLCLYSSLLPEYCSWHILKVSLTLYTEMGKTEGA